MQNSDTPVGDQSADAGCASGNGEIDLFELFAALWQRRFVILVFVTAGIAITGAYAYLVREVWISQARVVALNPTDNGAYFEKSLVFDDVSASDADSISRRRERIAAALFNDFLRATSILGTVAVTHTPSTSLVEYTTLSVSADSAIDARGELMHLIEQADQRAVKWASERFSAKVQGEILALKNRQKIVVANAEGRREAQLDRLQNALDVAKRAGVVGLAAVPMSAQNDTIAASRPSSSENLFLLGEKLLTAQIDSIKENAVSKPAEYYNTQSKIAVLEPLLDSAGPPHAFAYMVEPTMPTVRSKPKRSLIMVLGALLGGMVGCGFVLAQGAYRNRRARRA